MKTQQVPDTTLHKVNGVVGIYVYESLFMPPIFVARQSRTKILKCSHNWCRVAYEGHGRWGRGCSKCGGLSRG